MLSIVFQQSTLALKNNMVRKPVDGSRYVLSSRNNGMQPAGPRNRMPEVLPDSVELSWAIISSRLVDNPPFAVWL
jgi:hypothetical protein